MTRKTAHSRDLLPILTMALLTVFTLLTGARAGEETPKGLIGEAELGVVATSGNTRTKTTNARVKATHETALWTNTARTSFLHASEQGESTAQRFVFSAKSAYTLRASRDYAFVTLKYEDDRFSGYDWRVIETAGYGYRMTRKNITASFEAGPGARQSRLTDNTRTNELIARAAAKAEWKPGENSIVTEEISYEYGSEGAVTESETAVKSRINGALAMKVAYEVRHNSEVPTGKKQTDATTSITLVYDF